MGGLLQHEEGERVYVLVPLELEDKGVGRDNAVRGMTPACQCLGTDRAQAHHLDFGLEEGFELAVGDAGTDILPAEDGRRGLHRLRRLVGGTVIVEQLHQALARDGLFDYAEKMHAVGIRHLGHRAQQHWVQRADDDDLYARFRLAQAADEGHAVHLRHVQVGEHDFGRTGCGADDLQRLMAVGGFEDVNDAEAMQHACQGAALEVTVFRDEYYGFRVDGHSHLLQFYFKDK